VSSSYPISTTKRCTTPLTTPDYICRNQANARAGSIVTQAADYARFHISARPFQLFSVGLLIFGTSFCVTIFDHGGVQFSSVHDIWSPEFFRVVRCLTCNMSPVELGQDPWFAYSPTQRLCHISGKLYLFAYNQLAFSFTPISSQWAKATDVGILLDLDLTLL
jgi:hypothetical protein